MECGKYFSFPAPHLNKTHQMNAGIPRTLGIRYTPLPASVIPVSAENVLSRIRRGEINPDEQLALMAEGRSAPRNVQPAPGCIKWQRET